MYARIENEPDGFVVHRHASASVHVRWDQVRIIRTYKLDLLSYDEVCLEFEVAAEKLGWIEVMESDENFWQLTNDMEQRFPTIPPDWQPKVMFPPFETCEAILYSAHL